MTASLYEGIADRTHESLVSMEQEVSQPPCAPSTASRAKLADEQHDVGGPIP